MSVKKDIKLNGIDLTVEEKYESETSIGGGNIISKDGNNQIRLNPNNLCIETTKDGGSNWSPCGKNEYDSNNVKTGEIFNMYVGSNKNTATGDYSHAEGYHTTASGDYSHAEGCNTTASGDFSHSEGCLYTTASGDYSHAEGNGTTASGNNSHAEGEETNSKGISSHTEGYQTKTFRFDQIEQIEIIGDYAHAEGYQTSASGNNSHAEGNNTNAQGENSHASGLGTIAEHKNSFVMGEGTCTYNDNSLVCGQYNTGTTTVQGDGNLFVVGNGYMTGQQATFHNAFTINKNGNALINGDGISGSGNGNLNVVNNISAGGNITITGDATISGNTSTNNISANGSITATTSNISAKNDLTGGYLYLGSSNGNIPSYLNAYAKFEPSNNGFLYLLTSRSSPSSYTWEGGLQLGSIKLYQQNGNGYGLFYYRKGSSSRYWIFNSLDSGGGVYTFQNNGDSSWFKLDKSSGGSPSLTINHISTISENTNLNDYIIGKPIFLGDKYKKYNYYNSNYMNNFNDINDEKIKIDSSTCDTTLFNISNIPNNNFVGICSIISEPKIIKKTLEQPFNQYSIHELTQNEINEQNIDINNLPNDYSLVYKVYNYNDLNNAEPYIYYNVPVIAFATHGDYMFYVDDTEALIDTNLNTQKHYEVGDELTYDGKILILPEFNPDETLTELEQLQQLLNYNKQISKYNKLKKNSIGKISHIFTSQDCDDYKHYLAVFKSN